MHRLRKNKVYCNELKLWGGSFVSSFVSNCNILWHDDYDDDENHGDDDGDVDCDYDDNNDEDTTSPTSVD